MANLALIDKEIAPTVVKPRSWTRDELADILNDCYSKRWHIGKDAMYAVSSGLRTVLRLMEEKNVHTVEEALAGLDCELDEEYPL